MLPTWSVYSNAKGMHLVCKCNHFVQKNPPRASRCPILLSLAEGHHWCIFQSEPIHTAGLWYCAIAVIQLQMFSMPNISRVLATNRRFPQIASLIIHTTRLSLARTSTDLPPMSGICRLFIKTRRWVKNRAKIVQCELGIRTTISMSLKMND